MTPEEVPEEWVDAATADVVFHDRSDARRYLANAYATIRNDLFWEVVKGSTYLTCACGMDWEVSPDWGPGPGPGPDEGHGKDHCESGADATLWINGHELRIQGWRLTPYADWAGETGRWGLTGWLREYDKTADLHTGARLERAELPGRKCPTGQKVSVEIKGHGDERGMFLKVEWHSGSLDDTEG